MRLNLGLILVLFSSVLFSQKKELDFVRKNYELAGKQLKEMLKTVDVHNVRFPRSIDSTGKLTTTDINGWTSGFFAGVLWYAGEYLDDPELKNAATKWTEVLKPLQYFTDHHDLGFMMYNSFGHAYRITGKKEYADILIQTARSLATRYNENTKSIKSWNRFLSWHDRSKQYDFPVIIDNMMNLELLLFASDISNDVIFRKIAVEHAIQTRKNHVRPDYSSYHVVCYDSLRGNVLTKETGQGYADNSTWARGQAWGIYGFTVAYRESKMDEYLATAKGMADFFINHKNLPPDKIPYWDFDAGKQGFVPSAFSKAPQMNRMQRDVSAAAIAASALLELSRYSGKKGKKYKQTAVQILRSLSTDAYHNKPGENGNFILRQCVGSIPGGTEIDVPLIYADYYFLEALKRYKDWYLSKN